MASILKQQKIHVARIQGARKQVATAGRVALPVGEEACVQVPAFAKHVARMSNKNTVGKRVKRSPVAVRAVVVAPVVVECGGLPPFHPFAVPATRQYGQPAGHFGDDDAAGCLARMEAMVAEKNAAAEEIAAAATTAPFAAHYRSDAVYAWRCEVDHDDNATADDAMYVAGTVAGSELEASSDDDMVDAEFAAAELAAAAFAAGCEAQQYSDDSDDSDVCSVVCSVVSGMSVVSALTVV